MCIYTIVHTRTRDIDSEREEREKRMNNVRHIRQILCVCLD